jgi:hypothetical protein
MFLPRWKKKLMHGSVRLINYDTLRACIMKMQNIVYEQKNSCNSIQEILLLVVRGDRTKTELTVCIAQHIAMHSLSNPSSEQVFYYSSNPTVV